MADPAGRGPGGPKHDLFALGMTAVAFLRGRQPGSEFNRDELMIPRLEMGSLPAVMPPHAIPRPIVAPLSGLLTAAERRRSPAGPLHTLLNPDLPTHPPPPAPL